MMRLSTRDLFVILTFFAVISWCAGQGGYANPQFWIAAAISLGLGSLFVRWSGYRDGRTVGLLAVLLLVGFCTLPFGSLASLYSTGFLLLATLISAAAKIRSTRARYGIAMNCVAAALVMTCSYGNAEFNRVLALRKLYPIESLDHRLAYEPKQPATNGSAKLSSSVAARLTEDEQIFDPRGWRLTHLRMIHDREYEHFVRAAGFGIMRMGRPRKETVEMPPLRDIDFANAASSDPASDWNYWRGNLRVESDDPIKQAHDASRYDFLNDEGYGDILQRREQVVGFVPHAFHQHPLERAKERPKWSIDRIELVSLLKFGAPRVYVLDHLPRMDQLSSETAPTRPLNKFENSALKKLRAAEDIVVAGHEKKVEMLGSLRASNTCLECHNVQRGELLGAFSYQLTLSDNKPESAEQELAASEDAPTANDSDVD